MSRNWESVSETMGLTIAHDVKTDTKPYKISIATFISPKRGNTY